MNQHPAYRKICRVFLCYKVLLMVHSLRYDADMEREVPQMQKCMVILMGLQGSGKSTFYHQYLKDNFQRVNLDTLKTRHREELLIRDCLKQNFSFAVDNTNPTIADRGRYIPLARKHGYRVIGYFMESKLQDCIARNALRFGKERIPTAAIAATSNKLEMPSYREGFDELYFVSNDGKQMTISEWREAE